MQAAGRVGQLPFVDDEAGVKIARDHFRNDLVKGNGDGFNLRREQLQSQIRGGQSAGNRDPHAPDFTAAIRWLATIMGP